MIEDFEKRLTQAQDLIRIAKETEDPERKKMLEGVAYDLFRDIRPASEEDDEDE